MLREKTYNLHHIWLASLLAIIAIAAAAWIPNYASAQSTAPTKCVQQADGKIALQGSASSPFDSCTGTTGVVTCRYEAFVSESGEQYQARTMQVDCGNGTIDVGSTKTGPAVVECQDGWLGTSIGFGCALAGFTVRVLAGITAMFTTLLQWSSAAFSFAIERTIVNFKPWFDTVSGPITDAWTLFRDLANIAIIGLFVFIAISIILGLQEYGQKKLIARVIIIATLINFSFLFTLVIVNASNLFATTVYNAIPLEKQADGTPVKIGEQFTKNMRVYSYDDTRNLLMTQYNIQGFGTMFAYGAFAAIFALSATFVFLYGAFLIFARAVMLAVILLPLSSLAFASYLAPSFEEAGWKRWWHSLLQQSFMAPLMMIFVLISLNISAKVGQNNYDALANFATNPSSTPTWDVAFGFIVIVGSLFAGMYIASQLAGGAASRFAAVGTGSLVGAGAGITAWAGRNTLGRAAAMNAKSYGTQADKKNKDIEAERAKGRNADFSKIAQWEREYDKLRRKEGKSEARAKRTYDARGISGVGAALKATGTPAVFSEATKKNFAQITKETADHAAKDAAKATLKKSDAEAIAKQQLGTTEEDRTRADQEARDARRTMQRAREDGMRAIEEHQQAARDAEERKRELEERHAAAPSADLERQIREQDDHIQRARRSEASSKTRMEQTIARERPKSLNYNERVRAKTEEILGANRERVGDIAAHHTLSRPKQLAYDALHIHTDSHVSKVAREQATGLAKKKESWDEKKKEREYTSLPAATSPTPPPHHD